MISLVKADGQIADNVCVFFGKSTDNKDAKIDDSLQNGSIYYTIDTQEVYVYDKDTMAWIKQ
jgi:hypothetical protein